MQMRYKSLLTNLVQIMIPKLGQKAGRGHVINKQDSKGKI